MCRRHSKAISKLKKIPSLRPKFTHSKLLKSTLMVLILAIAFLVRLLPVRWGYYLNEFDPYYQFRQTEYIVKNGLLGANGWISWHDYLSWYPWGNVIRYASYPGLAILAATSFMALNTLGFPFTSFPTLDPLLSDPIYVFCVIFPVLMATLASLAIYFLGKDLGGEPVGMFAALFLALDSSYISRTALGFFDDESVGILSLDSFLSLFLKVYRKRKTIENKTIICNCCWFHISLPQRFVGCSSVSNCNDCPVRLMSVNDWKILNTPVYVVFNRLRHSSPNCRLRSPPWHLVHNGNRSFTRLWSPLPPLYCRN